MSWDLWVELCLIQIFICNLGGRPKYVCQTFKSQEAERNVIDILEDKVRIGKLSTSWSEVALGKISSNVNGSMDGHQHYPGNSMA